MRVHPSVRLIALLAALSSTTVLADASSRLHAVFDAEWQDRLTQSPAWGEQFGVDGASARLADRSVEAIAADCQRHQEFAAQATSVDPSALSQVDQINRQIFLNEVNETLTSCRFKTWQVPLNSESSFHHAIVALARTMPFQNPQDYRNYLSRLKAAPGYMDQNMALMRLGIAEGRTQPTVIIGHYPDAIAALINVKAEDSLFFKPFESMPDSIDSATRQSLKNEARAVIAEQLMPSFKAYEVFFREEYLPASKTSIAAIDFPDGKAFYTSQIQQYTTLELTAEQIHQIGRDEVSRIRSEMEAIIKQVDFEGTFAEFLQFLRTDPQFYATSAEELLKQASYLSKQMDGKLPMLFTRYPRQPYTVNPVPESIAPNYTIGRYVGAPLDSERPGQYWVNTHALDKRPLYNLEALTFHEAVPGHHFQTALAAELEGLPEFRKHYYISAFGEGWGLYSERLGKEVGFYKDPYSDFGRLTYEMWRAMRLVVDTGMHAMGMSREEAIALMESNTALSTHNVRTEIDRYIGWPGQALSYKLGEIRIRELRAKAEEALGERFDRRTFHDAVLANGSLPLALLDQMIDAYIAEQLSEG